MPLYPAIRDGDTTTHGGTVICASSNLNIYGKMGACKGDMVACPQCKGIFPIVEGVSSVNTFGKPIALEGMLTACGAKLIASQSQFLVEMAQGQGLARTASTAPQNSTPLFDEQFLLQDEIGEPLTGMMYELKFSDGSIIKGVTCTEGCTERIQAETSLELVEISYPIYVPNPNGNCCSTASTEIAMYTQPISTHVEQPVMLTNSLIGTSRRILQLIFGKRRSLTTGEITLAQMVFKNSIDYNKVKIHHGRFIPIFQPNRTAMTPFGTIHFPDEIYAEDYSIENTATKNLFIHEMVHVWQYQLGYSPFLNGIIIAMKGGYSNSKNHIHHDGYPVANAYEYLSKIQPNQDLSDFNMEQQASIIADYYINIQHGLSNLNAQQVANIQNILRNFQGNPHDKALLPKNTTV